MRRWMFLTFDHFRLLQTALWGCLFCCNGQQCSHLDGDDSRCLSDQVTASSLQPLSDQESSTDSLQTNNKGFAAPPEHAATVGAWNTADYFLQTWHCTHDITAGDQSQTRGQNLSMEVYLRNIEMKICPENTSDSQVCRTLRCLTCIWCRSRKTLFCMKPLGFSQLPSSLLRWK